MLKLATLCYIERDNKTLFLHRVKKKNDIHKDKWIGLGGKIENGESPEECIIREVEEESGLKILRPKLRAVLTFPNFYGEDWYVFLYTAGEFIGELIDSKEGKLKWIDNEKIKELNMSKGDKIFLKALEEEKFFSAKFIYKEEELFDYSITWHN